MTNLIHESLYLTYDGERSDKYGVINVKTSSGLYKQHFMSQREIIESETPDNDFPYFQQIKRRPIQFDLTLYFEDGFTDDQLQDLRQLFNVDFYKPMVFGEQPEKIYYCVPVDLSELNHNGAKQGYVTISFRCNSPFSFSTFRQNTFDLSTNTNGTNIEIMNYGDDICLPIIEIGKYGTGTIEIINNSDSARTLSISNLQDQELVTIDCQYEDIESDQGLLHYDDHNGIYLQLVYGKNRLHITGDCEIRFKYQFKYTS